MALGDKLPVVMESEFKAQMAGKMNVPQELPDGISLNDVRTPGEYYKSFGGETIRDMPYFAGSFSLKVEFNGSDGDGIKHTWSSYDGNDTWTRTTNVRGWRPWLRLTNTNDLLNKVNVTPTGISGQDIIAVAKAGKSGWYFGLDCTNAPRDGYWRYEIITYNIPGHATVKAYPFYGNVAEYIRGINDTTDGVWTLQATATPPEWHNAPLETGWSWTAQGRYGKDGSCKGYLIGVVNKASVPTPGEAVLRLPVGYRPMVQWPVTFTGHCGTGGTAAWATYGYIYQDGYLRFNGGQVPNNYSLNQGIAFAVEFPTA